MILGISFGLCDMSPSIPTKIRARKFKALRHPAIYAVPNPNFPALCITQNFPLYLRANVLAIFPVPSGELSSMIIIPSSRILSAKIFPTNIARLSFSLYVGIITQIFMSLTKIAPIQTLHNQQGEIAFRKFRDKSVISNYLPTQAQILAILKQRNILTKTIIDNLLASNVHISPFLEIGAERGQRSALLVSKFGAHGFALDLSLDSLLTAKYYAKKLGLKTSPILICADAYHLPFISNSIPFVFCFETLHHFPDPAPIIKECLRVTRGHFYFGEEPVRQLFNLRLWHRDYHLNLFEKFLKQIYLLPFLSDIGKSEVGLGILENSFWLDVWSRAIPQPASVELKPIFWGPQTNSLNPNIFIKFLLALQGGGISALMTKNDNCMPTNDNLLDLLACPTCHTKLNLVSLSCPKCKQQFVKKNGVYILLPQLQRKQLYNI